MAPSTPSHTEEKRTSHDSSILLLQRPDNRSLGHSICLIMTCTAAMIVNTSNATSASIALPTIGRELYIPENQLQWIVSAYSLSSGCLLLFFGRLADLYGRKKIFMLGTVWLSAISLCCGFARDKITLVVLRGLQGVGAAATIPASLGILAHAFPPSKARSIAFATFAAGAPVGAAFGMAIGGVLTQLTSKTWRSIFYLSTGLTILCLVFGYISINSDEPSSEKDKRVDWLGAFLITAGLVLIVFVLGEGEVAAHTWRTAYIITCLITGVLLVASFIVWQRYLECVQNDPTAPWSLYKPPPLMKISLWVRANGRFGVIMSIAFLTWCCFLGSNFWIQLYYQDFLRLSPVLTMIRLLPMFVTGILCNALVALVVGRVPIVILLGLGTLMTSVASLLFAVIVPSAPYWAFGFPAAVISVFGADFTFSSGTIFIAQVAMSHEQSVAGALFQTMTQIGTALGVTVTTVVFNRVVHQEAAKIGLVPNATASNIPSNISIKGYKAAQWAGVAFGILATVLAIIFFRGFGIVGHGKDISTNDEAAMEVDERKPNVHA